MDGTIRAATRRGFLGAAALTSVGLVAVTRPARVVAEAPLSATAAQDATRTPAIGQAGTPDWSFLVHAIQDPYGGRVLQPEEAPPGTRYVAAEVEVDNGSDQALNVSPSEVRLRDSAGVEYRANTVIGSEPRLNFVNMVPGERTRGWVWFAVAADADLVELVYYPPSPLLRVALAP